MPTCFLCRKFYLSVKILFRHFDFQHADHKFDFYNCVEGESCRSFNLKNSYSKHLLKHVTDFTRPLSSNMFLDKNSVSLDTISESMTYNDTNLVYNKLNIEPIEMLTKQLSKFLACLYANPIMPRNAVEIVVDGMETVLSEGVATCVKNNAEKLLSDDKISVDFFGSFMNVVKGIEDALINFKTEHKRFSYFTERGTFILPQEIVIGQRLNKIIKNGKSILEPVNCTQHFIPLRNVLKKFFSVGNVLSETLDYIKSLNANNKVLQNFIQGSYWQSRVKNHGERVVFPIFIFFDDFDSGNVLGSHSSIHKLGGVYVSVPCLPPYRSTLFSNIFMALIFQSSDRTKFGNRVIFKPLIDELNFLQETGIEINTPYTTKLYFELGLILGENLGLHSIIGFTESYSSNFPCRICTIRKEDMRIQCYANDTLLGYTEQYDAHLLQNDVSATGIREECVWFDVNNFSLFD